MDKKLHILVCPLDWGIGHASRCVPIIREFLGQGHRVTIAADRLPLEFLRAAFPQLPYVRLGGAVVRYPRSGNMAWKILLSAPTIIRGIAREHKELSSLTDELDIDLVVSDNRFGLWSKKVPSVYITHQLMIKMPGGLKVLEKFFHWWHLRIISKYTACWIPDVESPPGLSGDLAHKYRLPQHAAFVGPLSRFSPTKLKQAATESERQNPDVVGPGPGVHGPVRVLAMVSGPEPQRSAFESILIKQLNETGERSVLLRGLPGSREQLPASDHLKIYPHLPDSGMASLMEQADIIICRPGYSSIMDLIVSGRTAVLVPTPGQTEQQYLAGHLSKRGLFDCVEQDKLDVSSIINKKRDEMVLPGDFNINLLASKIHELIKRI